MSDLITAVWTVPGLTSAIVGGFVIGDVVLDRLVKAFAPTLSGRRLLTLALASSFLIDATFYAGQILDSYLAGDPGLPRLVSRFAERLLFDVALGIGTWWGLRYKKTKTPFPSP